MMMHRIARNQRAIKRRSNLISRSFSDSFSSSPLKAYEELVISGKVIKDNHQMETLQKLENIANTLSNYKPRKLIEQLQKNSSSSWSIFKSIVPMDEDGDSAADAKSDDSTAPRGLYMYGGVGTGKTFLMDLFFNNCGVPKEQRQRLHFLDFMICVHQTMHRFRKTGLSGEDLTDRVVEEMMRSGWLLCFDEFQVTDIADAMVIRQIFHKMWARGLVMVATSNRAPQKLYHNGLQRHLFVPFIAALEERCETHSLDSSTVDYRLIKGADASRDVYIEPVTLANEKRFEYLWHELRRGCHAAPVCLQVEGHELRVPCGVISSRMARFSFHDLCGQPLGATDYVALAEAFHTVFIARVPVMTLNEINQARRFILLIDTFYERNVKLVCLSEAPPDQLFAPSTGPGGPGDAPDEVFAFGRTASRLVEMQGREYLHKCWRPSGPEFLVEFMGQSLTEEVLLKVWKRYDVDGDDKLDIHELYAIMEDISELKSGHRNVPEEVVQWTFEAMDTKHLGYIERSHFVRQGLKYGMNVWWGGLPSTARMAGSA